MGAYLRAQDAVKVQPDYALAHFSLAEAAMKLNKHAEAVLEFQTYLKLEPDGKQAKAAEKGARPTELTRPRSFAPLHQTRNAP